jgi:hypothetical protein
MTPQAFVQDYLSLGFFTTHELIGGLNWTANGVNSNWAGLVEGNNLIVKLDGVNYGYIFNAGGVSWVVDYDGNLVGWLTNLAAAGVNNTMNWFDTSTTKPVAVESVTMQVVRDPAGAIVGTIDGFNAAGNNDVYLFGKLVGTFNGGTYTPVGGTAAAGVYTVANAPNSDYIYGAEGAVFGITDGVNIRTYDNRTGTINVANNTVTIGTSTYRLDILWPNAADLENKSADIYIYNGTVDAYSNFHGIIFGGTAAVSKDKAKELDKAVKNSIRSDVPAWAWEIGETPSNILNTSLMGNVFYAYRSGTPVTDDGAALTNYYAPTTATPKFTGRYYGNDGVRTYTSPSQATALGVTIIGKIYQMDFYHYEYVVDALTGVKDWTYVGTVTAEFIVDENTGVMTQLPVFAV